MRRGGVAYGNGGRPDEVITISYKAKPLIILKILCKLSSFLSPHRGQKGSTFWSKGGICTKGVGIGVPGWLNR